MKKLVNQARPVVMTTNREPLDIQLSISQRSGDPLTQAQDYTNAQWSPNRNDFPLTLDVQFKAYDPEKHAFITVGTEYYNWYIAGMNGGSDTLINTNDSSQDYYLEYVGGNKTGNLVVRKNVNYNDPVTLKCVILFTESSRSETYRVEDTVKLTSENRPEEFYHVTINETSVVEYRPLAGDTASKTLPAVSYKGNTEVVFPYTNGIKYFWYYMTAGSWTLIPTNGTYAPYVSGQNTNELTLNCDYIETETIKVMISKNGTYTAVANPTGNPKTKGYFEYYGTSTGDAYKATEDTSVATGKTYYSLSNSAASPDCDDFYQVIVSRSLPRIEALPYCKGGSAVNAGDKDREFNAVVSADGVDMTAAQRDEYIRLNWKSKPTNSNTVTDRGWGDAVQIPSSQLMVAGAVNVEVYPEVGILSPYELLTDDSPNGSGLVTDDSGSSSASQNGGYVVGRS